METILGYTRNVAAAQKIPTRVQQHKLVPVHAQRKQQRTIPCQKLTHMISESETQ